MDDFHTLVSKIVLSIPSGTVVSYGQVAAYTGNPRASREVGWAMTALGKDPQFPWWRVLNGEGRITIENPDVTPDVQQRLLEKEGVEFLEPLQLDIKKYRFRPDESLLRAWGLSGEYLQETLAKFDIPTETQSLF